MIAVIRQMLINSARSGKSFFLCGVVLLMTHTAYAEDGYDLWLRYRPVDSQWLQSYRQATTKIVLPVSSATLQAAKDELHRGLTGLLNAEPQFESSSEVTTDGLLIVGTPKSLAGVKSLDLSRNIQLNKLGNEGYAIRSMSVNGHPVIVVIANTDIGALYGTFGLLRMMQTRQSLSKLDQVSVPDLQLRMLNHWDNLDRHVERGYAGQSIWDWHKLPDYIDRRYVDYARAMHQLELTLRC